MPNQLFDIGTLGTFAGLTGATVVVTNAVARAINWNRAWFGLIVALVLCVGLTIYVGGKPVEYLLALLNACLVYLSAAGANSAAAASTSGPQPTDVAAEADGTQEAQFFRRWY